MTLRTLTCAELQVSPLNVRLNQEDAEATGALERSIAAYGLMYPLVVHPMSIVPEEQASAPFGVLAGGRRLRAIGKLVARGELPTDWPIDCILREVDPAQITELSLTENLLRRDLRPYEVHAAIARAFEQGASVEEIVSRTGQRERWVRQQLRLGSLAPEIFAAYSAEQLSIEQASAYGATKDRELQLVAWRHFRQRPTYEHHASNIRAFLKVGDAELTRLLRFVGAEAYRQAGGRFELDLFADGPEERGRIMDEGPLRELAEQRLEEVRTKIRAAANRPGLRFAAEPPKNAGTTDWSLSIEPDRLRGKIILPHAAEDAIVATLAIGEKRKVEASYWWVSRKAKKDAQRTVTAGAEAGSTPVRVPATGSLVRDGDAFDATANHTYAQAARAAVKDEHGLTADGLQVVRSLRRTLLRALLVGDSGDGGALGRDYLIWSLLRQELGDNRPTETGTRGLSGGWSGAEDAEPRDLVRDFLADEQAALAWEEMVGELAAQPFMTAADPVESLQIYVALDDENKNVAAAVLAGLSLLRSANVPAWRVPAHDRLAELAGGDADALRRLWHPSAAFLGLFPKMKRLELAQPHVGAAEFRSWHKLQDKLLTGACAGALEHAEGWVHPLLSFRDPTLLSTVFARPGGPDDDEPPEPEQDPNVNDKAPEAPVLQVAVE